MRKPAESPNAAAGHPEPPPPGPPPCKEASNLSRESQRKEVDYRETPMTNNLAKSLSGDASPGEKARCCVGKQILLRRNIHWENLNTTLVGQKENLPRKKKRVRYCVTFLHTSHRRQTVGAPEKREERRRGEVPKEDEKSHELLCIDMGWSICN